MDLRIDGMRVISRIRQEWKNNPYLQGYRLSLMSNIIGAKGFDVRFKNDDDIEGTEKLNAAWKEWCTKQYCTMAGELTMTRVEWLWGIQLHRDGEIFSRMIFGPNINKFGFSLDLSESDPIDRNCNLMLENGNAIVQGIEIDIWKRKQAFWIREWKPEYEVYATIPTSWLGLKRIPIEGNNYKCIFLIDADYANQVRGISSLASSLLTFHHMKGYTESEIIAARASSSKMGFISHPDTDENQYTGDEVDTEGNSIANFEPGTIEDIGHAKFEGWDPTHPNGKYADFKKAMMREASTGLGCNYNLFAGDLEGVNFSSLRAGQLNERDIFAVKQTLLVDGPMIDITTEWRKWAVLSGAVDIPFSKIDNYAILINGRAYPWVDPYKDIMTSNIAIGSGLSTRTAEARKYGTNYNDNIIQLAKENKIAEENGIIFNVIKDQPKITGADNPETDESSDIPIETNPAGTPVNESGEKSFKNKILKLVD
jgi:lambda family phage portal protein